MKRLVIGISGASGAILGIRILEELKNFSDIETHLVITKGGEITVKEETAYSVDEVKNLANIVYSVDDLSAQIASGSFETLGMIVAPCSMKTLAAVANGYAENLLLRAADVSLKENRPLILLTRETPLSKVHIKNMLAAKDAGATLFPPMLTFYNKPQTIDDMIDHIVGKTLLHFNLRAKNFKVYKEQ